MVTFLRNGLHLKCNFRHHCFTMPHHNGEMICRRHGSYWLHILNSSCLTSWIFSKTRKKIIKMSCAKEHFLLPQNYCVWLQWKTACRHHLIYWRCVSQGKIQKKITNSFASYMVIFWKWFALAVIQCKWASCDNLLGLNAFLKGYAALQYIMS